MASASDADSEDSENLYDEVDPILAVLLDGTRSRRRLIWLIDAQQQWPEKRKNAIAFEASVALPWLVNKDFMFICTSPHTEHIPGNDCKEGVYVKLEFGPAVFSPKDLLEMGLPFDPATVVRLQHCRQLLTGNSLHVSLAYLPSLSSEVFNRMEQQLQKIVELWKRDLVLGVASNAIDVLALKQCRRMTGDPSDHTHETIALIQRPPATHWRGDWTPESAQEFIEKEIAAGRYSVILHPLPGEDDKACLKRLVTRDFTQVQQYEAERAEPYQQYLNTLPSSTKESKFLLLAYHHASCPSNSACNENMQIDTRLSKTASKPLVYLLHMLREAIIMTARSACKHQGSWSDACHSVTQPGRWHATPAAEVVVLSMSDTASRAFDAEFLFALKIHTVQRRRLDWSWLYDPGHGEQAVLEDKQECVRPRNYQLQPGDVLPVLIKMDQPLK